MRLLYIHQYFVTPEESAATRSYWFARAMVERGHEVIVLTEQRGEGGHPGPERMVDGIRVLYLKGAYDNAMSMSARLGSFARFMMKSSIDGLRLPDVDLVYATSTPLTVGFPALVLRALKGVRYVFEVRDLWPEFPIQIGAVQNPIAIAGLRTFERAIYRFSDHIVALSPGMVDGVLAAGVDAAKVTLIPNMSKPEQFYPRDPDEELAKDLGLNTAHFNIIHFGSMGRANGLRYLVGAATELRDRGVHDIDFIFVGAGATEDELKSVVEGRGLKNVKFLGYHGTEKTSAIVNLADVSIVSFLNLPILGTNSPNKLFDSLAAGKPICVNSSGWTRDLVEREDCGFWADPERATDLATKLVGLRAHPARLAKYAENARRLALQTFDQRLLSGRLADLLERVVEERSREG